VTVNKKPGFTSRTRLLELSAIKRFPCESYCHPRRIVDLGYTSYAVVTAIGRRAVPDNRGDYVRHKVYLAYPVVVLIGNE